MPILPRIATSLLLASGCLIAPATGHAEEDDYILHDFGNGTDGVTPGPLIKVGGLLYGTTPNGGNANGDGTIYSVTPQGVENVLYRFGSATGDGLVPYCALTYVSGVFYGTTSMGGANFQGAVFSYTPGGTEAVLYSFTGGTDGYSPEYELFYFDGALYGVAGEGSHGDGVVFKLTLSGEETIAHAFAGGPNDGAGPSGGLIKSGGVLYGVTSQGGTTGNGTVYSLTNTGSYSVIYSFKGGKGDGSQPSGTLLDVGGTLYGTTRAGGQYNLGTVFSVTPGGSEHIIHTFGALKGKQRPYGGATPYSGLIYAGGLMYGTTAFGGATNEGVVYSLTLQGVDTVVHTFLGGVDGAFPYAGLTNGGLALYGVGDEGGTYNGGVVFRLKPLTTSSAFRKPHGTVQ